MSVNGSNNFLNIEDANLRVRNGSVHAQGMTIGGAIVSASHGLQSVSDTGNTTSNTLQFTNPTTAFKATSNIELTSASKIIVESNVLMDFKTLGQIEFPGSTVEQEYPPRALTGYETLVEGHGVFTVYSTGGLYDNGSGGNLPWTAFNKFTGTFNDGTSWVSEDTAGAGAGGNYNNGGSSGYGGSHRLASNTPLGEYLVICLPYPIALNSYSLSNLSGASGYGAADFPRDYIIYGSSDSVNWEVVDSRSDQEAGGLAPAAHVSAGYLGYTNNYTVSGNNIYSEFAIVITDINSKTWYDYNSSINASYAGISEWRLFGTPGPTTLDKGSLTLGRSLDVPRVSRYDVDTETPRPEKLLIDYDTTVNSSLTDISGQGNHGRFISGASYSAPDKAFTFDGGDYSVTVITIPGGNMTWTQSMWFKSEGFSASPNFNVLSFFGSKSTGASHIWNYKADQMWQDHYGKGVYFNYTFEENIWYHAVSVYHGNTSTDANVRSSMYINGVKQTLIASGLTSAAQTIPTTTNYELADYISGTHSSGAGGNARHNGLISNVKFYSVALEASEVQKLYRLGRTGRSMVISDTAVGIGKAPEAQLDVRGNLNVDGVIKSNSPAFSAYEYNGFTSTGGNTYVTLGDTFVNKGGCYDTSNGIFTAPISGTYRFTVDATLRSPGGTSGGGGTGATTITLHINNANWNPTNVGRPLIYQVIDPGTNHQHVSGSLVWNLTAGDTVRIYLITVQSGTDINFGEGYGRFIGYLIS